MIDVFPSHQLAQIRTQLAAAVQGIVCQTLCRRADGPGRAVATEILFATSAIRNLIRDGKQHQITSLMQAGGKHGMQTMDQALAALVKTGRIMLSEAVERALDAEELQNLAGRRA